MEKKLVLLLLLIILSGCQNKKAVACSFGTEEKNISLDIKAINDDITSINVRSCFEIPYNVINDEEKFAFLNSQLDDSFHFEDNKLIREYEIELDDIYSLQKTIKYLNNKRYYCE